MSENYVNRIGGIIEEGHGNVIISERKTGRYIYSLTEEVNRPVEIRQFLDIDKDYQSPPRASSNSR